MENITSIGERIVTLRNARNMTQSDVASRVGVSRVAVTKWESGLTQNMKLANLIGLSTLFKISVEELITGRPSASATETPPVTVIKHKVREPGAYYSVKDEATKQVVKLMESMNEKQKWRLVGKAEAMVDEQAPIKTSRAG